MATLADDDALVVLKTETASSVVIYVMGRIIASYDKYLSSENFFLLDFNSSRDELINYMYLENGI